MRHVRFEPSGFTQNPDIPVAKSLTDYIFRFLNNRFLRERTTETPSATARSAGSVEAETSNGAWRGGNGAAPSAGYANGHDAALDFILPQADAPACQTAHDHGANGA